ncbi:MAG: hypothetical protein NVS9B7_10980 [Flavisolibacter sp.]
MTGLDWLVIIFVLTGIIAYGLYKSRTTKNLEGYFLSNRSMPWYLILLSIMGTQASAITFLSGPGQSYSDGMRFVQYYFGLPLAMVVVCISFVPLFSRLKVYTAYEFLENRFDRKTRTFTSFLFLLQRGLSTGISIYAPSLILSSLFGWDIFWTNIIMGGLLIIYTVSGGARAVAYTQTLQFVVIFVAMGLAGYMVVKLMPPHIGLSEALHLSGKLGKLNVITSGQSSKGFDWNDRYNVWSGLIGGFFLALSYFGTDQSQVGRYLTAQNNRESRLGLLMNGMIKIPMQFFILLIGVLVFAFYQFTPAPLSFNDALLKKMKGSPYAGKVQALQLNYDLVNAQKKQSIGQYVLIQQQNQRADSAVVQHIRTLNAASENYRSDFKQMALKAGAEEANDTNYIFLSFVKNYLPQGLKGLLIAMIFISAWGSIAAALNSLAASTVIDFHQRIRGPAIPLDEYRISKWYTLGWGIFSILIAQFSSRLGQSLIEAVNVLGSLFYGVILGIFLVAFYVKRVKGAATFYSALIIELMVIALFFKKNIPGLSWLPEVSFLWLNLLGAAGVGILAGILELLLNKKGKPQEVI